MEDAMSNARNEIQQIFWGSYKKKMFIWSILIAAIFCAFIAVMTKLPSFGIWWWFCAWAVLLLPVLVFYNWWGNNEPSDAADKLFEITVGGICILAIVFAFGIMKLGEQANRNSGPAEISSPTKPKPL